MIDLAFLTATSLGAPSSPDEAREVESKAEEDDVEEDVEEEDEV